ncbi:MAG: tRNA pseudouridine(38-40) synthase TruA [Flavobacteriales bacterium]
MRYFIDISYNGKNYHGWQKQPDVNTVQETIEQAFSTILQQEIQIVGAGRTDAGVHAKQLIAHFDADEIKNSTNLIFKINSLLPNDISINEFYIVKEDAHARFTAISRSYEYVITLQKNPFLKDFSYLLHYQPDVELMNEAASILLSHKDFQCFSKVHTDVKTYLCNIEEATWKLTNNQLIFYITANRFLRNMVRAIVGTLLDVGFKKTTILEFQLILQQKNRNLAGASAPAKGLFLTKIVYPENIKYE